MLIKKEYKKLVKTAIYAIIGAMTVILLCIIILNVNGIWNNFVEEYIIFNFKYVSNNTDNILNALVYFVSINPIIILISLIYISDIIFIIIKKKKDNKILITSLINFIFTFIVIIMPGNLYAHYGIILVPTYIVPILWNIKFFENDKFFLNTFIAILVIIQIVCVIYWYYYILTSSNEKSLEYEEICNYIKEESDLEDTIIVLGNDCSIYLDTNRNSCSKYIYQNTLINIDEKFKQELMNDIEENNPKIIIFQKNMDTKRMEVFLEIYKELIIDLKYEQIDVTENCKDYIVLKLKL